MTTLITGDIHLSSNPRDRYRIDTMMRLAKKAKKDGITKTIILGDLTEEKDRHNDWLTNKVVEVVRAFTALGDVHILQGNHDSAADPNCPFFHFLRHMPKVWWYSEPTPRRTDGLGRVMWLPHTRNWKEAWSGLSLAEYDLIFAHCMFTGSALGNGRQAAEGVPRKIIPGGVGCIAADVHIPQTIGNIRYVGAPYTIDFGDVFKPRVLYHDAVVGCRSVDTGQWPQKKLLEFDGSPGELDAIAFLNEGDILKIRVSMLRSNASKWPIERDRLRAHWTSRGMVVHSIIPVIMEEPGKRVKLGPQQSAKSDMQIFREFSEHRGVDKKTTKAGEVFL